MLRWLSKVLFPVYKALHELACTLLLQAYLLLVFLLLVYSALITIGLFAVLWVPHVHIHFNAYGIFPFPDFHMAYSFISFRQAHTSPHYVRNSNHSFLHSQHLPSTLYPPHFPSTVLSPASKHTHSNINMHVFIFL